MYYGSPEQGAHSWRYSPSIVLISLENQALIRGFFPISETANQIESEKRKGLCSNTVILLISCQTLRDSRWTHSFLD